MSINMECVSKTGLGEEKRGGAHCRAQTRNQSFIWWAMECLLGFQVEWVVRALKLTEISRLKRGD